MEKQQTSPTIKLYDADAYETGFTAQVVSCTPAPDQSGGQTPGDSWDLILDRTLFFPEEGGQTPDRGSIRHADTVCDVTDVQITESGIIIHTVTAPIPTGSTVEGVIDWDHRFSNMQQHSGEHIFSGIVHSRYGYSNVGFHLSDNVVTMDYDGYLDEEQVADVEYAVNEAIAKNVPVICRYPDAEELAQLPYRSKKAIDGPIRIVEITGYDICACCAPHVAHTGEIGLFKVVDAIRYKGGVRVSALCGFRALMYFRRLERIAKETARTLNAPVDEQAVRASIRALFDANVAEKQRVAALGKKILDQQIAQTDAEAEDVILFADGVDNLVMRNALNELAEQHTGYCAVFSDDGTGHSSYIIASRTRDCREVSSMLRDRFGAKGGGKSVMTQGSLDAPREAVLSAFAELTKKNA